MEAIRRRFMEQTRSYQEFMGIEEPSASTIPVVHGPDSRQPAPRLGRPPAVSSEGWSMETFLAHSPTFQPVKRVSALSRRDMDEAIAEHEKSGEPLIIEDWHKHPDWPSHMFGMDWLLSTKGHEEWVVRNVRDRTDKVMTLKEFIHRARHKTSSDTEDVFYGKDAPCPKEWKDWVYSTGLIPCSLRPNGSNDLLKNLDTSETVESLMCYLGTEDSFTPCHKDLCASSGQNIMCHTEEGGSSFWFMTASADAPKAGEYFQSHIGLELDWEDHVATIEDFSKATFTVYVAEQKLGDLVLVPPRSCHQVVNHGGLTVKTSWSRMTIAGLRAALHHELPIYRRVCREEQYRVKQIVYRSLIQATAELNIAPMELASAGDKHVQELVRKLAKSVRDLIELMDYIIHDEFTPNHRSLPTILNDNMHNITPASPFSTILRSPSRRQAMLSKRKKENLRLLDLPDKRCNFACDFCGADIFQSFFECNDCAPEEDDDSEFDLSDMAVDGSSSNLGNGLLLCPGCYAEGRMCQCGVMHAAQCRPFLTLLDSRNDAARSLARALSSPQTNPARYVQPLSEEDIVNSDEIKMFSAGCKLLKLREAASSKPESATRSCRGCKKESHKVPYMHGLHCTSCHASMCYNKLLKIGMHSAAALLAHSTGGSEWHTRHLSAQDEFKRGARIVRNAERSGAITIYRDRLVIVARTYTSCRPHCPSSVKLGWYDKHSAEDRAQVEVEPQNTSLPESTVPNKGSILNPPEETLRADRHTSIKRSKSASPSALFNSDASPPLVSDMSATSSGSVREGTTSDYSTLTPLESPVDSPSSSHKPVFRKKLEMFVLLPPLPKKRLRTSHTTHEEIPRKKRKLTSSSKNPDTSDDDQRMVADVSTSLVDVLNSARTSVSARIAMPTKKRLSKNRQVAPHAKYSSDDDRPLVKPHTRAPQPRNLPSAYDTVGFPSPVVPESPDGSLDVTPAFLSRRDSCASPLLSDADPPPSTSDGQAVMTASVSSIATSDRPLTGNNPLTESPTTVEGSAMASGLLRAQKTVSAKHDDLTIITASATVPTLTVPTTPPASTSASAAATTSTAPTTILVPAKKARIRGVPPGITAQKRARAFGRIETYSSQSSSKIRTSGTAAMNTLLPGGFSAPNIPLTVATTSAAEIPANAPPTVDQLVEIQRSIGELTTKVLAQEKQLDNRGAEIKVLRAKYETLSEETQRLKARLENVPTMVSFEVKKALEARIPGLQSDIVQVVLRECQERVQQICNGAMASRSINGNVYGQQSRYNFPPLPGPQGSPLQTGAPYNGQKPNPQQPSVSGNWGSQGPNNPVPYASGSQDRPPPTLSPNHTREYTSSQRTDHSSGVYFSSYRHRGNVPPRGPHVGSYNKHLHEVSRSHSGPSSYRGANGWREGNNEHGRQSSINCADHAYSEGPSIHMRKDSEQTAAGNAETQESQSRSQRSDMNINPEPERSYRSYSSRRSRSPRRSRSHSGDEARRSRSRSRTKSPVPPAPRTPPASGSAAPATADVTGPESKSTIGEDQSAIPPRASSVPRLAPPRPGTPSNNARPTHDASREQSPSHSSSRQPSLPPDPKRLDLTPEDAGEDRPTASLTKCTTPEAKQP